MVLVSVLFFSLQPKNEAGLSDKILLTESRVGSANDFVRSLKAIYVPEAVRISSYKAAKVIFYEYKNHSGAFNSRDNATAHFRQLVTSGTVNKGSLSLEYPIEDFILWGTTNSKIKEDIVKEYGQTNLNSLFRNLSDQSLKHLNAELDFNYGDYNIIVRNDSASDNYFMVNATVNFSVTTDLANWTVNDTYSVRVNKKDVDVCFNDSDHSCFPLS